VRVTLLPSNFVGPGDPVYQYATSYLINDTVAIDAGTIGFYRGPWEQARIGHVFLSHSHLDHIASLPILLGNIAGLAPNPVSVYASENVQKALRGDIFNGRVWPNFLDLRHNNQPFLDLNTLHHGQTVRVEGLSITPVAVDHAVPTQGFIIEDGRSAIVITSDTGPTTEIWKYANRTANLKAVFVEASFPDALSALAATTGHLTSTGLVRELDKLQRPAQVFAVHLKAAFRDQVIHEIQAHHVPRLEIAQSGQIYEF
jgi:ribonuclease BN (tRNA processing enzyme)